MESKKFIDLFGEYISGSLKEAIGSADISSCSLNKGERSIKIMLQSSSIIPPVALHETKAALIQSLNLKSAQIEIKYAAGLFNPAAAMTIIDEMKFACKRIF